MASVVGLSLLLGCSMADSSWQIGTPVGFACSMQAGVATSQERFAVLDLDGEAHRLFGRRDPAVAETPFWIFFARESAAVLGDEIAINTSFFPTIRIHGADGDSLRSFGSAPPDWIELTAPPVEGIQGAGDRQRIEAWARSFTVVSALAAAGAGHLVVQYGRHEPNERDPYELSPRSIDVYEASGERSPKVSG